jgi:hypothetical protein
VGISCVFCLHPEMIQHLFFDCHFARFYGERYKQPLILMSLYLWHICLMVGSLD